MKYMPLAENSKSPLAGEDWHHRISDDPAEHARWLALGLNRGLPLEENGLSAIDFDDKEAGRRFWKEHPELCTFAVETRRGIHLLFKGKTRTRKFADGDIKGNGYLVYPPSVVEGWTYKFLRQGELQPFPDELFPVPLNGAKATATSGIIGNVRAYISKIESIEGQNGSAGLVRAAARCRDAGLSEAESVIVLLEWNKGPTVNPPWTDKELARAVTNVFKKGGNRANRQIG